MSENTTVSGASAESGEGTIKNLLYLSVDELVLKSYEENWKQSYLELWLKIKNAQNLEGIYQAQAVRG